jgi:hypothetical protein
MLSHLQRFSNLSASFVCNHIHFDLCFCQLLRDVPSVCHTTEWTIHEVHNPPNGRYLSHQLTPANSKECTRCSANVRGPYLINCRTVLSGLIFPLRANNQFQLGKRPDSRVPYSRRTCVLTLTCRPSGLVPRWSANPVGWFCDSSLAR